MLTKAKATERSPVSFPQPIKKLLTPRTDPESIYNQFYSNNKTKNTQNDKEINVILTLEDNKSLNYIVLTFSNNLSRKALIDTGACSSAFTERVYRSILSDNPDKVSTLEPMPSSFVKMASGRLLKIIGKCRTKFQLDKFEFDDDFLVLPAMNSMSLGNPFFKKHDIDICPSRNLLNLPQMTFRKNEIKVGKKRKILQTPKIDIFIDKKEYYSRNIHNLILTLLTRY